MATEPKNSVRMDLRLTPEQKDLICAAAAARQEPASSFMRSTLVREAQEVLERETITHLSKRDRDIFLEMLQNPPKPNAALRKAASKFRRRVKGQNL